MVVIEHGWEQGALNPDGTSKDASQIDFGSDTGTPPAEGSRVKRGKNARYSAAIAAEKEVHSDDDQPTHKKRKRTNSKEGTSRRPKASKEPKRRPKKQKTTPVTSPQPLQPDASSSSVKSTEAPQKRNTRNAIWYFFTGPVTDHNFSKEIHEGDKFYRCRHGKPKDVLRMSTAMRGSLNGLTSHLKNHAPDMYRLYEIMSSKDRKMPVTDEEIAIAEGRKTFAGRDELVEYLNDLSGTSIGYQQTLRESFERANQKILGPWDQGKSERLLVECMFTIPGRNSQVRARAPIQRRVEKMGDELKKKLVAFFPSLDGMVSISLDAWTSP
ncbi:hypothetical protein B0H14DRAFT_3448816 [Mycena olivaceomarginata]|nr:hypothetical protein B0H14DRAFT_3448816 [Mycena olivaceomarginata]